MHSRFEPALSRCTHKRLRSFCAGFYWESVSNGLQSLRVSCCIHLQLRSFCVKSIRDVDHQSVRPVIRSALVLSAPRALFLRPKRQSFAGRPCASSPHRRRSKMKHRSGFAFPSVGR
jgi:hypothetical protein